MVATQKKHRRTEQTGIAVSRELRAEVEEVMNLGKHGTLLNTLAQALDTHKKFLRGELVVRSVA